MASLIDTAITTSHEIPTDRPGKLVTRQDTGERKQAEKLGVQPSKKYRHTFAVHSATRASCLSQDSAAPTSFTGFRNLGALVISQYPASHPEWLLTVSVVSNLRLMIENFKKVVRPRKMHHPLFLTDQTVRCPDMYPLP
jgi:diacylglycerol O-acyltransferase-1